LAYFNGFYNCFRLVDQLARSADNVFNEKHSTKKDVNRDVIKNLKLIKGQMNQMRMFIESEVPIKLDAKTFMWYIEDEDTEKI